MARRLDNPVVGGSPNILGSLTAAARSLPEDADWKAFGVSHVPENCGREWIRQRCTVSVEQSGGQAVACVDSLQDPTPVDLLTAATYGVLAGSTVTNTNNTVITGDLGVSPGAAVVGFPPGTVSGTQHAGDAAAAQAQLDLTAAYVDAASRPTDFLLAPDIGGQTLPPGVYTTDGTPASLGITGTVTLDAAGDPDAVWIFQIESTLITAPGAVVALANGAQACNVFWQVGSSATLDTTTEFVGTILALTAITANNGANVGGRLLARNAAVTLDENNVAVPSCTPPVAPDCELTLVFVAPGILRIEGSNLGLIDDVVVTTNGVLHVISAPFVTHTDSVIEVDLTPYIGETLDNEVQVRIGEIAQSSANIADTEIAAEVAEFTPGNEKPLNAGNAAVEFFPFLVEYNAASCTGGLPGDHDQLLLRAQRGLMVRVSKGIAFTLSSSTPDGAPNDSPNLPELATDITPAGGPSSLINTVSGLLEAAEGCGLNGEKFIHAPGWTLPYFLKYGLLTQVGNVYKLGPHTVVLDQGYSNEGPTGSPFADTGEAYIYVTGPVEYATGPEHILEDSTGGVSTRLNQANVIVARQAIYRFDPCCVFGALALVPQDCP